MCACGQAAEWGQDGTLRKQSSGDRNIAPRASSDMMRVLITSTGLLAAVVTSPEITDALRSGEGWVRTMSDLRGRGDAHEVKGEAIGAEQPALEEDVLGVVVAGQLGRGQDRRAERGRTHALVEAAQSLGGPDLPECVPRVAVRQLSSRLEANLVAVAFGGRGLEGGARRGA